MAKVPNNNLPPESQDWRRWVEAQIQGLSRASNSIGFETANSLKSSGGTLAALAVQIERITELYENLAAEVAALASSGVVWTGPVNTSVGNIQTTATVISAQPISSIGSFDLNLTTLPGQRRTAWIYEDGRFGNTISSIKYKTNLSEVPFSAEEILSVMPYVFQYKAQLDIATNPDNEHYNPDYVAPLDIGLMAEMLVDAGLGLFVFRDENGDPRGIHYDLFGAVCSLVLGRHFDERLRALEEDH